MSSVPKKADKLNLSMKYGGYTYSQVTTFMNNEMAENVVTQSTLHQLIGCTTR